MYASIPYNNLWVIPTASGARARDALATKDSGDFWLSSCLSFIYNWERNPGAHYHTMATRFRRPRVGKGKKTLLLAFVSDRQRTNGARQQQDLKLNPELQGWKLVSGNSEYDVLRLVGRLAAVRRGSPSWDDWLVMRLQKNVSQRHRTEFWVIASFLEGLTMRFLGIDVVCLRFVSGLERCQALVLFCRLRLSNKIYESASHFTD